MSPDQEKKIPDIIRKPRYFATDGEQKAYFENEQELLKFIQNNDPTTIGCDMMPDFKYDKVPSEASDD